MDIIRKDLKFKYVQYIKIKNKTMGKRIIRLTESDLTRIVKRVIKEQDDITGDYDEDMKNLENNFENLAKSFYDKLEEDGESYPGQAEEIDDMLNKLRQIITTIERPTYDDEIDDEDDIED